MGRDCGSQTEVGREGSRQEFVVLDYRNRSLVLSKRLERRVQLVMKKVRFPATTRDFSLSETWLDKINDRQYQAEGKKKVVLICRDPFHYVVRQYQSEPVSDESPQFQRMNSDTATAA